MRFQAAAAAAIIAGFSSMQSCPAPIAAFIPLIVSVGSDGIAGIIEIFGKRDLGDGGFELEGMVNTTKLEARATCVSSPARVKDIQIALYCGNEENLTPEIYR